MRNPYGNPSCPAGIHFLNEMCCINEYRKNFIYFSHAEEMR